jgi:transposase
MARKRISMKKIRELLRLKSTTAMSDRQIARALNISRPLVGKYWEGFIGSELSLAQIEEMPDSVLVSAIEKSPREPSERYRELFEKFPYFVIELRRPGVTLQLLWEEYKEENKDGFQYSQFCNHFRLWRDSSDVRMHINHKAGDKMFVDYAGNKLSYTDRNTGKEVVVETFVAVLGASGLTYVEASMSQEKQEWIRSNERAFHYFGGSTDAVVPDNLLSAVSRADRYEPDINPDYAEFAEHYHTVIIPARVREARDKALVENAVRLSYQRIYARLRNRVFFSLNELNEAIAELLEKHNTTPFQRLPMSRRELFERTEASTLHPLPRERFPMKTTVWATVQFNYHVELREDFHYYSVPHYLYTKEPKTKVKLVFDERIVAIYYDNVRIAQHRRDRGPKKYSTLPEHMPDRHRAYAEWSPERLENWAKSIGSEVAQVIRNVLASRKHPEQAYKVCMGILSLAKKHSDERLNRICKRANQFGTSSLKTIQNMIKLDQEEEIQQQLFPHISDHENIRGSEYYHEQQGEME